MAKIIQQNIFSWKDVEGSGELERLKMVIEAMPDDELMKELEGERRGRRDDYPVRAVWNSILAGIVYQHVSIESLRRELMRNGELRQAGGFDPAFGERAVPSKDAYSLMLKKLIKKQGIIDRMFEGLVEELKKYLSDFGRHVAIDSKKIESYARGRKEAAESCGLGTQDVQREAGRRQHMGEDKLMVWVQAAFVGGYDL